MALSKQAAIEYQRELRRWAKEHHVCPACKTRDERTVNGMTYCARCAARYRSYYKRKETNT